MPAMTQTRFCQAIRHSCAMMHQCQSRLKQLHQANKKEKKLDRKKSLSQPQVVMKSSLLAMSMKRKKMTMQVCSKMRQR